MQPKRITAQKLASQRADTNYKQSSSHFSPVPQSFRETNAFSSREFAGQDEFASGELASMDFAMPEVVDPRVFQMLGARATNGHMSARARSFYQLSKRGLDISVSLVLLMMAMPLLLIIAALVKMTSKGPVFFAHRRLGHNGKAFDCLKFRTMIADAEERLKSDPNLRQQFEEKFKLEDDPRITPLGNFLRRTSLDELPQLLHVLRGEMSLVGPRPIVENELSKYSIYANKLLSVKPGLSGLWQVCGRSHTTYPQRVMMDMHYIDHRCLTLDLQLLLLTASAVVKKSGAW
jgi:lipopolysaccharide/colanic/teichoic acid biosynthesis glycosyltransferase